MKLIVRTVIILLAVSLMMPALSHASRGQDMEELKASIESSSLSRSEKASLLSHAASAMKGGIPAVDVSVIVKRGLQAGWEAGQLNESLSLAMSARQRGLPARPVLNRIEEGLSKGVAAGTVLQATDRLVEKLAAANALMGQLKGLKDRGGEERGRVVGTVAWALERSVPERMISAMGEKVTRQDASLSRFEAAVDASAVFVEMGLTAEQAERLVGRALDKRYSEGQIAAMERRVSGELMKGSRAKDVLKMMEFRMERGDFQDMSGGMGGGGMTGGSGMGGSSSPMGGGMGSGGGGMGPGGGMGMGGRR